MTMLLPGARVNLNLSEDDAARLRAVLEQTARPGTFQARLITRIDAAVDEAKPVRPTRTRRAA